MCVVSNDYAVKFQSRLTSLFLAIDAFQQRESLASDHDAEQNYHATNQQRYRHHSGTSSVGRFIMSYASCKLLYVKYPVYRPLAR